MTQYLVVGKELFETIETRTQKQAIDAFRQNGYSVTAVYTAEEVQQINEDCLNYKLKNWTKNNTKKMQLAENLVRYNAYVQDGIIKF
jgi:hypothetical protein